MRMRLLIAIGVVLAIVSVQILVPTQTLAQAASDQWTLPRTPDGQPDLQGVWANNNATPLERPTEWKGKDRLTEAELAELKEAAEQATDGGQDALFGDQLVLAAIEKGKGVSYDPTTGNYNQFWIADRDFDTRTSLVIDPPDGRVPTLTEEAEQRRSARVAYRREHPADSWEDRPLSERCITYGVPRLGAGYNSYYQVFQSRDHVVILMEMIHDVRVIPLDERAHLDDAINQWHGDSRGRWAGDTLVIETTNYSPKSSFRGSSDNLHLTERLTLVGPNTLNYEVTIDDPTTWTKPWTVMISLRKSEGAVYEYACHEGNYGMEGILSGHRVQEKAAAESASK